MDKTKRAMWRVNTLLAVTAIAASFCAAEPQEPEAWPDVRPLRDGWVKTWYIYNDRELNGILDPGDELIARIDNWWTPSSSHSQHNYSYGPYGPDGFTYAKYGDEDKTSGPMAQNGANSYWLPREENAIHFYMTYSQTDNDAWDTTGLDPASTDVSDIHSFRHVNRNGWALGWVTNDIGQNPDGTHPNNQNPGGTVEMDMFVHDGQATYNVPNWGLNQSNPEVALSNDIAGIALDDCPGPGLGTQYHPPQYDHSTKEYSWTLNEGRMVANSLDANDLTTMVDSMEIREYDPNSATVTNTSIYGNRTPQAILNDGLTDHTGTKLYEYQDAFQDRSTYAVDASDGGVIAGLAGLTDYDPQQNNWGDQQVIRIDVSESTFETGDPTTTGGINRVVFYDFGYNQGATQISPVEIALNLWDTSMFPEHRFYIAQVEMIPEPATVIATGIGGALLLLRRRKQRLA